MTTSTESILALVPPPVDGVFKLSVDILADVIEQAYKAGGEDAIKICREELERARAGAREMP